MSGPFATPPASTSTAPTTFTTTTTTTTPSPAADARHLAATSTPLAGTSSLRTPSTSPRPEHRTLEGARKVVRNISPGLLARMKFLNHNQDNSRSQSSSVGRIPESQIRTLDEFHKDRTVRVERRGTAWSHTSSQTGTPLIPQLTGESVPALALAMDQSPPPGFESDRSSFISTSDKVLPSDSEAGELPEDTQKYRLPDITKTKSLSQTIAETDSSTEVASTRPPTPPPKDTPPVASADEPSVLDANEGIDVEAYFQRRHLSRANSIYTISRASFTNQIQQLTSISLPPAASLSSGIAAIPTSTAAGRALHEAANQIKVWMTKAAEVLNGLDAEDDVEWAAAAGKEGLAEVDAAIGKFEELVNVYITAIEELQSRPDIAALPSKDLTRLVVQMEDVVNNWQKIKQTLKGIKNQVEIAMEWEELWNLVLGEIGHEIEVLTRLVFEMEERRHRAISDSVAESAEKFDIAELETIVEENPRQQARIQTLQTQNNRFSLPPAFTIQSPISPIPQIEKENSRLLSLFAKLQPLRASLDFLPMRLSSFQARANKVFPSACDELLRRKDVLEKAEKKLEADADALREELGEDKWVHSFRQAGSKAIAMYESLMKSVQRLRQAIDDGDEEKLGSRISTYKDKREHYPPSMKRVLELIDIEMRNRATVNGEILRIQQDVRQKVSDLEHEIHDMDDFLEEFTSNRKLRDSVSTVFSARTDASMVTSAIDTPGSSPASSIIMTRDLGTPAGKKSRQPSTSSSRSSLPASRRYSSLPTSTSSSTLPRKSLTTSRLETIPSAMLPSRELAGTPSRSVRSTTPSSDKSNANKPRWNGSTNMRDTVVGHNFKPLSLTTPSPYGKGTPPRSLRSVSSHSAIPIRSPLSHPSPLSPPHVSRPASTTPAQQPGARRPLASTIQAPSTPAAKGKAPLRTTPSSTPHLSTGTRTSSRGGHRAEDGGVESGIEESPILRRQSRPASAMNSRRSSMLPTPKQRTVSGSSMASITGMTPGRTSRLGSIDEGRTSRTSGRMSSLGGVLGGEDRPRWRG